MPGRSSKGKEGGEASTPAREKRDIGVQVSLGRGERRGPGLWVVGAMAVALVAMGAPMIWELGVQYLKPKGFYVPPEIVEDLGMDGVILFKQHDRNNDGVLSVGEFEPIAHRLLQINETVTYSIPIDDADEVVTVQTAFQPLKLETMTKDFEEQIHGNLDSLLFLKTWRSVEREWENYGAHHFSAFLPEDPYLLETLGEVWYLVKPPPEMGDGPSLSANRYLPPHLSTGPETFIHRLLSMFHRRPFVYSRFAPQGSVATVRASNDKFVDIWFRIHGEFQLNNPPFNPFWFTPAQFTGNVIISKDGTKVLAFHLYVPTDKLLNVDMEWMNGPTEEGNMEVDIGFMPQMELFATRSSIPIMYAGQDQRENYIPATEDYQQSIDAIKWKKQISEYETKRELEKKLYPFKKVEYYNFTDAYTKARELQKPVHSILLWGALDDQSC